MPTPDYRRGFSSGYDPDDEFDREGRFPASRRARSAAREKSDFAPPPPAAARFGRNDEDEDEDEFPVRRSRRRRSHTHGRRRRLLPTLLGLALLLLCVRALRSTDSTPDPADTYSASKQVLSPAENTLPDDTAFLSSTTASSSTREDEVFRYRRSLLSGTELTAYDRIRAAIANREARVSDLTGLDADELFELCSAVYADWPEYFWFSGSTNASTYRSGSLTTVTLTFTYTCSATQIDRYNEQLEQVCAPILASLAGLSDYEQVKGLYETLINRTVYDYAYEDDQSMLSVLLEGRGVCAGYAAAFQYLCGRLGLPCLRLSGLVDSGPHTWNLVQMDSEWYEVDVTWGDPTTEDGSQTLVYDYLGLTTDQMNRDHQPENRSLYPLCTATACNYFRREGHVMDDYDEDAFYALLLESFRTGTEIPILFSDSSSCAAAVETVFGSGNAIEQLLERFRSEEGYPSQPLHYSYSTNDAQGRLSVLLTVTA